MNISSLSCCAFIAAFGEGTRALAFKILQSLREEGIVSEMDYQDRSLKGQMRLANKLGCRYVVILGEEEQKRQNVILRDMKNKSQKEVRLDALIKELS